MKKRFILNQINKITGSNEDFLMVIQKNFKTLLSEKLNMFIKKHIYGIKANENAKKQYTDILENSSKGDVSCISPKILSMINYDLQQCNVKIEKAIGNIQVICYEILKAKNKNCTENRDALIMMFDKALQECYRNVIKDDPILNTFTSDTCESQSNSKQVKKLIKKQKREEITGGPDEVYDIIMNTEPVTSSSAKKKKGKKVEKEVYDQIVEDFRSILKTETVERGELKKIVPNFSQDWLFQLSNIATC